MSQGVTLRYTYSGIRVTNEFDGSGAAISSYDYGTDLIRADLGGEGERWYTADGIGSLTTLAAADGTRVARQEYDAWGEMISAPQPTISKVGYTGYRHDEETGLAYAVNRYYRPELGRFSTTDPVTINSERLRQPQGLNLYPYVMGNPNRYVDPDGLEWLRRGSQFKFRQSHESLENLQTQGYSAIPEGEILDIQGASGRYASLNGKKVYLAYPNYEGPGAFEILADLPDTAEVDFILPDPVSGELTRYEGVPSHARFTKWSVNRGMFVAHFEFAQARGRTPVPWRGGVVWRDWTGPQLGPVTTAAIPRWARYDMTASAGAGFVSVFRAPASFLAWAEDWEFRTEQIISAASIDNPWSFRGGVLVGIAATASIGPRGAGSGAVESYGAVPRIGTTLADNGSGTVVAAGGQAQQVPSAGAAGSHLTAVEPIRPVAGRISVGGGTEARHIPRTNLNAMYPSGPNDPWAIPNLVIGNADEIGEIFASASAQEITSNRLPYVTVNWDKFASGAFRVLRPGGRVEMNVWVTEMAGGDPYAHLYSAFTAAGFRNVTVVRAGIGTRVLAVR